MAGGHSGSWPGFFRVFAVFAALMLLLAQGAQELVPPTSGAWQVLSVYEGLTRWSIPVLFLLWGMSTLEGGGRGGTVIAKGTPEEIAKSPILYTGKYVEKYL